MEYHCRVELTITLANLSRRLGCSVRFDPATDKIVGDLQASKLARPLCRRPWRFPARNV